MSLKLITPKESAENMLTNAKNSIAIYDSQIAFYEYGASLETEEVKKANWLVERDKIKAQKKSMEESVSIMEPFVAQYN